MTRSEISSQSEGRNKMNRTECEHAITIYLDALKSAKKSEKTILAYSQTLRKFRDFLSEKYSDEEEKQMTELVVVAFRNYLTGAAMGANSIAQHIIRLHTFFGWCEKHNLIDRNVVNKDDIPDPEQITYKLLTSDELKKLIETKPRKTDRRDIRAYAITVMLATMGLRNSELRYITPDDLDFENQTATIRKETAKGSKGRIAPFPKPAQEAVKAYLECGMRPSFLPGSVPLFGSFSNETGRGRTEQSTERWHAFNMTFLNELLKRYVNKVIGRDAQIHAHTMRHMATSYWEELGVPMRDVQLSLGHSSITTTEKIYSHVLNKSKHAVNVASAFEN